jgi:hypothetical protein
MYSGAGGQSKRMLECTVEQEDARMYSGAGERLKIE